MSIIKPFKALRPQAQFAKQVASRPYDVLNSAEAKVEAQGNNHSFLYITKSEISLPESADIHAPEVYETAKQNLAAFMQRDVLFKENKECYYIYQLIMNGRSQTGLVAVSSVDDYENDIIKKHEFTRPEKELDRINHIKTTGAQTGNVFLAYRNNDSIDSIIENWKKVVAVAKDTPGFIVNRVARPFYGEALRIYEEGIADFATIDHAVKSVGGFKMGPFQLMDFIGNDVNYTVTQTVFEAFYHDPRYKPSFTQKRFAEAGYLGRKSGKGFYDYTQGAIPPVPENNPALLNTILDRILVMLINEAADALFLNIASAKDIDAAMTKGVNYPKGLLAWADEKSIDWCVKQLDTLYNHYHEDRYRCSALLRTMSLKNETFF